MKKLLLITTLTAAALTTAQAQNGIYLSIDAGIASQSGLPDQAKVNATNVQTSYSPNALRASVGYNHDLNSRVGIGLDAALGQYGKTTYTYSDGTTTEVTSRTLEFLATSTFHLNKQFDLIAKVGGLRLTPNVKGKNAPPEGTQICPEAAIEAAYNMDPHLAFTLTYAHVFGSKINTVADLGDAAPGLNEGLLGVRYTFGS